MNRAVNWSHSSQSSKLLPTHVMQLPCHGQHVLLPLLLRLLQLPVLQTALLLLLLRVVLT
jgi:hypothetical protein